MKKFLLFFSPLLFSIFSSQIIHFSFYFLLLLPFFFTLQLNQKFSELNSNLKSVATGSWGCGERQQGDTQFKALIQWCAASVANVPGLIYYTCSRESLNKLDTVVRVVRGKMRSRPDKHITLFSITKFFLETFLDLSPSCRPQVDSR